MTKEVSPTIRRFAELYNLSIAQTEKLIQLAHSAKRTEEWAISYDRPGARTSADRCAAQFETYANYLGFTVLWPSLWPELGRGDRQSIRLPSK
jgi:hypothetical protein